MKEFTEERKIAIAQEYLNLHKNSNSWEWQLPHLDEIEDMLRIFNNIMSDVYGEVREKEDGVFEIEISKHDSHNGLPILFEF